MNPAERYAATRVKLYEELFNRAFDTPEQERLRSEADALWPTLTDEEKRAAERGYFTGVQAFNRRDPNYKGPSQQ